MYQAMTHIITAKGIAIVIIFTNVSFYIPLENYLLIIDYKIQKFLIIIYIILY